MFVCLRAVVANQEGCLIGSLTVKKILMMMMKTFICILHVFLKINKLLKKSFGTEELLGAYNGCVGRTWMY